jgi:hypothetical protein
MYNIVHKYEWTHTNKAVFLVCLVLGHQIMQALGKGVIFDNVKEIALITKRFSDLKGQCHEIF